MALKYNYKAKDKDGKTKSGIVEANTSEQALKTLQENKLLVIELKEKHEFSLQSIAGINRVSEQQVAQFTRLLSTMLGTGLPLSEALSNLINQNSGYFREVIETLLHDVQSGSTLSSSMAQFPKVFNQLYVSLMRAGEASGKIGESLGKLADSLEAQLEFKGRVKGALLYPIIIVIFMIGVGVIMLTTVIPKISEVYKEFGAELPLPTRILVGISELITQKWWLVAIVIAFIVYILNVLKKNKASDMMLNDFYFKIPIFGKLEEEVQLTVMTRTLSTLVSSGVGIIEGLKITAGTVGNNYLREGLVMATSEAERGIPLSTALKNMPQFPMIVSQLVAIGEETGTLDESLLRLSKFFQEAAERHVKALTTALEPILIIVMGVAVGGMAIAVLLPMFNLVSVIK